MTRFSKLVVVLCFINVSSAVAQDDVLNTVMHPHDNELRYNSVMHPHAANDDVSFSFTKQELNAMAQAGLSVIVHHGAAQLLPDYQSVYLHTEVLPVFVTRDVDIQNISLDQLKGVLNGDIRHWNQLGVDAGRIVLLRHAEVLKSKALDFQLATQNLAFTTTAIRSDSYEKLASDAIDRNGAIILGLRGDAVIRHRDSIKAIAVNQHTPMSGEEYPFRVPIYLYIKNDSTKNELIAEQLISIAERRAREDGMDFATLRDWYSSRLGYSVADVNSHNQ